MLNRKGFTLIEIIIVLGILAILMGIAVPVVYRQLASSAEQATKSEMENLKKALIGDPTKIQNGVRTDFGALGDWGGLLPSLEALVEPQTPAWFYDKEKKVGAGWNGPYISETFSEERNEYKLDAWGNEYAYSTEDYTNEKGELVDGKIVSYGPDRAEGGGDDLTVEILKNETTAKVFGYVNGSEGKSIFVTIYFPQNGTLMQDTCGTDANGYFEFNSIPFGIRPITVAPELQNGALAYVQGSAKAKPNDIEFKVVKYSEEDITISSLKAEYTVDPPSYYREVKIGKKKVWEAKGHEAGAGSGETVYLNPPYTITGPGSESKSYTKSYTICVDSSNMQVPDINITGEGAGEGAGEGKVVVIEIKKFRDDRQPPGQPVDMTGVPFTITFSDGSVISFTPTKG